MVKVKKALMIRQFKDKEALFDLLDEAIEQGVSFCAELGIDVIEAIQSKNVFKNLSLFHGWADTLLAVDEQRKSFNIYENTISGLYEACKPEVLGQPVVKSVAVFGYLRGVVDSVIDQQDVDSAIQQVNELLDESVIVDKETFQGSVDERPEYQITQKGKVWDLSRIDYEQLQKEFVQTKYKNIVISDLRAFIEKKLADMLDANRTRRDFAERLQDIIDRYNAGSTSADEMFKDLMDFKQSMLEEDERHTRLGLTEYELELYDIISKNKMTKPEEQKVRLAAKALLKRLTEEAPRVLVQDWFKDMQTRLAVRDEVGKVLDMHLPEESYNKDLFVDKRDRVFELTLDLAINHRKWAA